MCWKNKILHCVQNDIFRKTCIYQQSLTYMYSFYNIGNITKSNKTLSKIILRVKILAENQKEKVYWTLLDHGSWKLNIAATDKGLCYVGSPDAPLEELTEWVRKHIPNNELIENKDAMEPYESELIDYLDGRRKEFTEPLDLRGTKFQQTVWDELLKVPFGKAATYTEIAERINRPDAVRAVGTAIGANPVLITVPCHRMFGKRGEWRGYRGGLKMKEQLLEIEKM